MQTIDGTDVAPEVTLLDTEMEQVAEAMQSDGPQGALIILMAHRDGRITLRSNYDPHQTASWMYELAITLMQQYPENQWPTPQSAAPAEEAEGV